MKIAAQRDCLAKLTRNLAALKRAKKHADVKRVGWNAGLYRC